ncbi:MAG TPA: ABC transporter ATP-binding protein [Ramlibacter sp.]|uniref:ABC transporter ATP-binding protein n=1 Tax=Ramlibacter sp. TaxID=1917967 RepID=UPI002B986EDA|nr:ABC transporter ATP-binding protein [Ramlibacter sp.]HVZ43854.1 ABC transporter ATP-binding protein [Ramlibacter sp.]
MSDTRTAVAQPMPALQVTGLKTVFALPQGALSAVDGVDLSVRRGEVLGIVGESGCGKSTMALTIAGLLPPRARMEAGTIHIGGRDVSAMSARERRQLRGREVAMVFQDPLTFLNPVMRVGEQIAEKFLAHEDAPRAAVASRVQGLLREVGLAPGAARMYPHELSGGMRQRVLIAIALACGPGVVIADEPTSALDVTTQAQILELFRDLQRAHGTAVLLITHDIGVAAEICDEVCVMYAGRIVERGTVFDVLERPAHPYTQALLAASAPAAGGSLRDAVLAGLPPDLLAPPAGCRFHPRCAHATARCSAQEPPLRRAGTHSSWCWLGPSDD